MTQYAAAAVAAIALSMLAPAAAEAACAGQPGDGAVQLDVAATDVRNGKGEVAFTVYPDDSKRFLAKGGKLLRSRVAAVAGTTGACFWLKPGHYAIAIYHDENGDHDFNRTLFAIKEGFGFSNDAPTTFGIPSFRSARFAVPATRSTIRIKTRYSR
ncbi:DUF2141 domain-containing protein [Sphingomonas sp. DT-204]|uniref:DUF2141 domain-containing protein n=1 Tax=Sphingomonas sp. DT-204 TaxID=3396166 RepID=UPI003F1C4164